jgi:hypothetical protein
MTGHRDGACDLDRLVAGVTGDELGKNLACAVTTGTVGQVGYHIDVQKGGAADKGYCGAAPRTRSRRGARP